MELRQQLKLHKCTIESKEWFPKNPEPTTVLVIEAPLTTVIADVLKCRAMAFSLNDEPNRFEGGFGLEHEVSEVEIKVSAPGGGLISLFPKVVKKFRIEHDSKDNLMVKLRAHFSGYSDAITKWCDETNTKEFEFLLLSLQGELFEVPAKGDGPEGGTRVDMSPAGDGPEPTCMPCAAGVPLRDGELIHTDLRPCVARQHASEQETATNSTPEAPLASVVMMCGSRQKGPRGRKPRDREREAIADGTAPLPGEVEVIQ